MEPLVNHTHYCSSDSYYNSKVFRVFWLLERLVTNNGTHGLLLTIVPVVLTTIAKFSGFSGYSKGWLLQIMEPLVNHTHYCSSDSYRTTLEKPILLSKWHTRNPLHFYSHLNVHSKNPVYTMLYGSS